MSKQRKGVGYIRVSRVNGRDGDSFISPKVQRETIARIAKAKNVRIVDWFEDLDQSGGKWERPGFQDALTAVTDGDVDVMVVAKLTRFARSIADTHKALERLEANGGGLICADLDVDTTTPTGRLIRGILAVIAAFELELARENWLVARTLATKAGKFPGRLPLGYRRGDDKRVEIDPVAGPAIAELFRSRAGGTAFSALAEMFTASTGLLLHPQSVGQLLANRAYLGELRHGAHTMTVDPVVTKDEWTQAQGAPAPRPARSDEGSLLAGLLTCASCGRPMTYRGGKSRQYTCQRFGNGQRCYAPVLINADPVDALVERRFLERHHATSALGLPADQELLASAERELDRARADLAATLALDLGASPELAAAVAAKQEVVAQAEAAYDILLGSSGRSRRVAAVGGEWQDLSVEQRRRLLAAALECVIVHRVGPGARIAVEQRVEVLFVDDEPASAAAGRARA